MSLWEASWEGHENLKGLLNWLNISDEEVDRIKSIIAKQYNVPLPFKIRITDKRMCRCMEPHGKKVTFDIVDYSNNTVCSNLYIDDKGFSQLQ